jgi:hypothetical protein
VRRRDVQQWRNLLELPRGLRRLPGEPVHGRLRLRARSVLSRVELRPDLAGAGMRGLRLRRGLQPLHDGLRPGLLRLPVRSLHRSHLLTRGLAPDRRR